MLNFGHYCQWSLGVEIDCIESVLTTYNSARLGIPCIVDIQWVLMMNTMVATLTTKGSKVYEQMVHLKMSSCTHTRKIHALRVSSMQWNQSQVDWMAPGCQALCENQLWTTHALPTRSLKSCKYLMIRIIIMYIKETQRGGIQVLWRFNGDRD